MTLNQLYQLGITNIRNITIENTDINKNILDEVIQILDLNQLQFLKYRNSEGKIITYYQNEDLLPPRYNFDNLEDY